ncbi:MAG: AAA family ATPase [Kiloniellaceae bacterium]
MSRATAEDLKLPPASLRWRCDAEWLPFETTAQVAPVAGVVGQDDAMEALRFGLESQGAGHNVFVRGLTGTGRMTLVRQLIGEIEPAGAGAEDRAYVHNFQQADRPKLITLPRGQAREFRKQVDGLIEFIETRLAPALTSEAVRAKRSALDEQIQERIRQLGKPFDEELRSNGLALVPVQINQTVQPTILPLIDDRPVTADELEELREKGAIDAAQVEDIGRRISEFTKKFAEMNRKTYDIQLEHGARLKQLYEGEARTLLDLPTSAIRVKFPQIEVSDFIVALVDDLVANRLSTLGEDKGFTRLYRVNVVLGHGPEKKWPVIVETAPSLENLLGSIDREFVAGGALRSDHMMIHAGAMLRADGGYLVLEVRELLAEPGSWKILLRTLKTGKLEITPSELSNAWSGPILKPEPIDLNVKVILIGDPGLYQTLDAHDPDFSSLFKVLADFETSIERSPVAARYYAGVIARLAAEEGLPAFSRQAVARLVEQGARIAGRHDRLTTRFGRLSDIAREAAFIAGKAGRQTVTDEDVDAAIRRGRHRADLPARQFRRLVAEGTLRIQTRGAEVGQVNGLAVTHAGPLTYGFPSRITATIGPGTAGAVNIEREADLSGAIHTKGFYILGGLLRHLLKTPHPLAFSASIAFEQSYGGIDGDSASGAEMCCLLSALTEVPLRQDLAMTGAIDQLGHIQPIGAVTEKAEGFFFTCKDAGLTGTQGIVIPRANAGDLMLAPEIAEACDAGQFHIYAVDTIEQALEIFTGRPAGEADDDGRYAEGTLLHLAEQKALDYWNKISPAHGARA